MDRRDHGESSHDTLVIVLSTVFGIIGIVLIALLGLWCLRSRRKHILFNRGLTPIGDDEIATWKVSRAEEKEVERYRARPSHASKDSTNSARIQYQKGSRPSTDAVISPRSFINNSYSLDLPRVPEPAAFARAPNARTGLTDETVPGDDPFVPPLRRQPSRLQKLPPNTPKTLSRANSRTRASRSNSHPESVQSSADSSPTGSRDATHPRSTHARIYSSSSVPPQIFPSGYDETYTGLSPPPSRRQDIIGQAIG
jgi:FtsZ-interacting cell division protein ZipA